MRCKRALGFVFVPVLVFRVKDMGWICGLSGVCCGSVVVVKTVFS